MLPIPKIEVALAYIGRELEELEREDFTRLKLVQGKKKVEQKEVDAIKEKETAMTAISGKSARGNENDADITAAFDAYDDEDVVFQLPTNKKQEESDAHFQTRNILSRVGRTSSRHLPRCYYATKRILPVTGTILRL